MAYLGELKADLRRALLTKRFVACVAAIFVLHAIPIWYEMSFGAKNDIVYFFNLSRDTAEIRMITLLLCTLPFATSFCTDWNSQFIKLNVVRSDAKVYADVRVFTVALSSFLSVALALLLIIAWLAFSHPVFVRIDNPLDYPFGEFLAANKPMGYLLMRIACVAMGSAFWSAFALWISTKLTNMFVVLFSPLIGYYVLTELFSVAQLPVMFNINYLSDTGIQFVNPAISLIYVISVFMILLIGIGFFFRKNVQGRLNHG